MNFAICRAYITKIKDVLQADTPLFYTLVSSYLLLVAFSHFCNLHGLYFLMAFMTVCMAVMGYMRFIKGETSSNNILFLTTLSFLFYGCFQSPVFAAEQSMLEQGYFAVKFIFIGGMLYLIIKNKFCNFFSALILYAFFIDSTFISYINLGISKTRTEYYSILESTFVLLLISSLFEKQTGAFSSKAKLIASYLSVIFVIAHLGNYWAAGFAKTLLDGGPLSWLSNETMVNLKRAELWGLPMEYYAHFILNFEYIKFLELLGNAFVYLIQLSSIIVPFFPVILLPLTVLYDVFHVLVGLMAGVFFYKWIYINILILAYGKPIVQTFRSLDYKKRIFLSLAVLLSYSFSSVVHLGWYETRQGNLIHAYGVYEDGREIKLHNYFFGSGDFYITNKTNNAFKKYHLTQMGALTIEEARLAKECALPLVNNEKYQQNRETMSRFTQRFLEPRSDFSKLMILIEPYHLLLPHFQNRSTLFEEPLAGIRFEIKNYCIDEKYKVYKEETLDEFTVYKEEP